MRVLSFVSGLVFAIGLCVSGMVRPSKVIGFLDVAGRWDPSLAFVMVGALAVFAASWRIVKRRRAPLLGGDFPAAPSPRIDAPLVVGAAIFGVGWGLAGYCPGPALVALVASPSSLVFVVCMVAGMLLHHAVARREQDLDG